MDMARKLPIGIQSFEKLRNDGFLYVDKTEYIHMLAHNSISYFLSRPRRFGKSLLLSTMKAYWEGKKELFTGLKIEELEKDNPGAWQPYPIFYIDFNTANFREDNALEGVIEVQLQEWEKEYGETTAGAPLGVRFGQLLKMAHEKTGKRSVVLVDEYDKPLIETAENKELIEHNKAVFKGFFSVLKKEDAHIRFVFITGVTKFNKVSIFSDLNQLVDISMSMDYSEICGITEQEMKESFMPEIKALAGEQGLSLNVCLEKLKAEYDGYRFHQKGKGLYNPFSLLNALAEREFDTYWFASGTPTFLTEKLRNMHFDAKRFNDGTLCATKSMMKDYRDDNADPIPLLYQTGYLTIIEYNAADGVYTLGFPNGEVQYGFFASLLPAYVGDTGAGSGKDILSLKRYMETGNVESVRKVFEALFAGIPYPAGNDPFEHDFQSVFYITFTLLGQYVQCEQHTYNGRIDCVAETKQYIYIFEFKRDKSAGEALAQIEDMHYADPYAADQRKLYKIGANFNSATRQMDEWKVVER